MGTKRISAHNQFKYFWRLYFTIFLTLIIIFITSLFIDLLPLTAFRFCCRFIGVSIVLIHASWLLTRFIRKYSQKTYVSPSNRAVLITGCDSGFGHQLCKRLDNYGFTIFAGCLFPDGAGAGVLRQSCSKNVRVVKMDVTQNNDVSNVITEINNSGLDLWAVVNNAGIGQYSLIEWGSEISVFEKVFAVNLFGVIRVTKMCLPLLRKSNGRVINMASTAGRFSFSGMGAYCMSKYAVRAFSDGLRREMTSHGVKVITLEPNLYRTAIMDHEILSKSIDNIWNQTDAEVKQCYGGEKFREKFKERLRESTKVARIEIFEVVDAQEEAVTVDEPDIYYRCAGPGERPALWTLSAVSDLAQDYVLTGSTWGRVLKFFSCKY